MKYKILKCKCHKIDNNGNVYSKFIQFSKKGIRGIITKKGKKWIKLNLSIKKTGYLQVNIHKRIIRVNRLIAINFLKNEFAYPEVHHINGNKLDNKIENLRWGNQKQNAEDRDKHGNTQRGEKNKNSKLTDNKIIEIRELLNKNNTLISIANKYKVSKKLILLIKQKKIWKHVK